MSTLAYEFYLHLRAGYMFPMQDAEALKIMTSEDLKGYPIELHILPDCSADPCVAAGRYLNDDGVSLDVEGKQNIYTFDYSQPSGGDITLTITPVASAADGMVNKNDVLGTL